LNICFVIFNPPLIFATVFHKIHNHPWGRSLLGAFLFALLGTGVVPRQWLHELCANHSHQYSATLPDDHPRVSTATIQCQCLHFIHHQTPYIYRVTGIEQTTLPVARKEHQVNWVSYPYTAPRYFFSLHAPPSA